jgi:hypothetical protein
MRRSRHTSAAPIWIARASMPREIGGFVPKPVKVAFNEMPDGPDYTWAGPQHTCLCGNDTLAVAARFSDNEISFYFLDGRCLTCGSYLIVPTEGDDPLPA